MSTASFPEGFVWGVSTSAFQIEGATSADGRGPSIWDTFSADRAEACDHYHRYPEDVRLMKDLGMAAYRFSVSWGRVFPEGRGKPNQAGLDFYDRLVDEVLGAGITPYATLYHWDLPQALEDLGGWPSRDTAYHFADYAAALHEKLGDRVDTWFTLNEPWVAAFLGYGSGIHAPGRTSASDAFKSAHHMLLAHGLATRALRSAGARQVGTVLNISPVLTPAQVSDFTRELSGEDAEVVARIDTLANRQFLEPMLRGAYPAELLPIIERSAGLGHVHDGDLEIIAQPLDLLGVNYYTPLVVQAQPSEPADPAFPGSEGVLFCTIPTAVTAMGWPIVPDCLSLLLRRLSREYPDLDLLITENGADFVDVVTGNGIHDTDRISFIEEHLRALRAAVADGARVRGYLVWTLLDNLEWTDGYQRKFGIVHVDFATQRRRLKDSALWYRDVIRRNGLAETRRKRPTLETVAARSGVSRATVSRVVNGESSVSQEVRAAVLRAVSELGYVPNAAARSLVTQRTNAIALVLSVPRQGGDALTAAVVQYVTSLLEGAGKQITLMLADTAESHRRIVQHVESRLADGVVLLPPDRADTLTERLSRTGVPLVLLGKPAIASMVPYVDVDHTGGAAAARRLLGDDPALDAVFAATDQLAIGALQAARETGRRVPEDLAVVGFDDVDAASATTPGLTTVRVPVADQALALARLLLSRLEGRHTTSVVLPARLVVRESA